MSAVGTAAVLAQLMGQEQARGVDMETLRAIVEEAGELGATRALTRLGLADEAAHGDLAELRQLIGAWRAAKTSAWKAAAGWCAALLLTGLAIKLGFGAWLR